MNDRHAYDAASGRPVLITLSAATSETVSRLLEDLRFEIGAPCIFLADMQGQPLVQVGSSQGVDVVTLLTLLSSGFVANAELNRRFGDDQAINLNFHKGPRYDIYSVNIGHSFFLTALYKSGAPSSRVGIIWLYLQRIAQQLLSVLSSVEEERQPLNSEFGSLLTAEMDAMLVETHTPADEAGAVEAPLATVPSGQVQEMRDSYPHQDLERTQGKVVVEAAGEVDEGSEDSELMDLETAIARGIIQPYFRSSPLGDPTDGVKPAEAGRDD